MLTVQEEPGGGDERAGVVISLVATVVLLCLAAGTISVHKMIPRALFMRLDPMSLSHAIEEQGASPKRFNTALG